MQKQFANETFTFNFNSRETFIAWRSEWRSEYAEKSAEIREGRAKIVALGKALAAATAAPNPQEVDRLITQMARIQTHLRTSREEAGYMMRKRAAATAFKNAQLAATQQAA